MATEFATRLTHFIVGTSATQIANGDPVYVFGYTIANAGGTNNIEVTLRTAETSPTTISIIELDTTDVLSFDIPFIADKGIEVLASTDDEINFTIFHSNAGM